MNRRNFLKRSSTVAAALAICPAVLISKQDLQITHEWKVLAEYTVGGETALLCQLNISIPDGLDKWVQIE